MTVPNAFTNHVSSILLRRPVLIFKSLEVTGWGTTWWTGTKDALMCVGVWLQQSSSQAEGMISADPGPPEEALGQLVLDGWEDPPGSQGESEQWPGLGEAPSWGRGDGEYSFKWEKLNLVSSGRCHLWYDYSDFILEPKELTCLWWRKCQKSNETAHRGGSRGSHCKEVPLVPFRGKCWLYARLQAGQQNAVFTSRVCSQTLVCSISLEQWASGPQFLHL